MFGWKIVFAIFLFLHAFQNLPICLKALDMEFILAEISEALELQYECKLPKCRPPVLAVPKLEQTLRALNEPSPKQVGMASVLSLLGAIPAGSKQS